MEISSLPDKGFKIMVIKRLTELKNGWTQNYNRDREYCCSVAQSCPTLCNPVDCRTACQASLSITNSRSSPKLMSTESMMPFSHTSSAIPFSSRLQSFPASGSFPMSQFFSLSGQSIGVSASTPVLPMNIQDWSPLGWTGWISLQFKGLSRVFFNTTVQKHQFSGTQLSL